VDIASSISRSNKDTVGSLAVAFVAAGAVVGVETAICFFALDHRLADVVMVYLLGVVLVAMRFGYAPSLFTAAASVAAFDFFFTVPYFSFAVADKRYVLTFAIMFFVAFVISNRTEHIRRIALERVQLGEHAQRAQLEVQNERLRNALLSSVSHDLRTPLAVIKGAVTALLEVNPDRSPERREEYLTTISDEASRMNRLVRNLLNMTSLEAGALRVRNKEWQPLEEVIGVALNRLDEQLDDRQVRVDIPPDASLAPFDAILVEQVFVNLVENAIKYTPPSSAIFIAARRLAHAVEITVADSGSGVPAGEEESIFEKFHRAAKTGPGMGIGLTICRGIVMAHGGTIRYAPAEGGGASFRFTLPLDEAGPPESVLPEAVGDP
jgi:K+-sensing histidine kinase KdpD